MNDQPTMKQILPTALIVVFLGVVMVMSNGCTNPDGSCLPAQTQHEQVSK